jgi:hypothetical protein
MLDCSSRLVFPMLPANPAISSPYLNWPLFSATDAVGASQVIGEQQEVRTSCKEPDFLLSATVILDISAAGHNSSSEAATMGAGQSKSEDPTKHVFTGETPIQFSQEYVGKVACAQEKYRAGRFPNIVMY